MLQRVLARRARRRLLPALVMTCCLIGQVAVIDAAAVPRAHRINFKRGQTSARVKGRLSRMFEDALFDVRARRGQHMRVEIIGDGPTRGFVTFPSGQQEGQPGGLIYDDVLPETGDYHIRVTESQMGEAWKGKFILEVIIK